MNALELVREFHHNAVVSSLQVAESFEKRHDRVLRAIDSLLEGLLIFGETPQMFFKSTFEWWSTSSFRILNAKTPKAVDLQMSNRHFKRGVK